MIAIERNVHNNWFEIDARIRWAEPQKSSSLWNKFEGGASSLNLHVWFFKASSLPHTSWHDGQRMAPRWSQPPDFTRTAISWPGWKHSYE